MSTERPSTNAAALSGWRARAWAWVLFVALFKGLIPHAALASVMMDGNPALVWCAPGSQSAAGEAKAASVMADHSCICASAGDSSPPPVRMAAPFAAGAHNATSQPQHLAVAPQRLLPPPARGPPTV